MPPLSRKGQGARAPPNAGPPFRSSLSLATGRDEGGCGGSGCRRGSPQAQVLSGWAGPAWHCLRAFAAPGSPGSDLPAPAGPGAQPGTGEPGQPQRRSQAGVPEPWALQRLSRGSDAGCKPGGGVRNGDLPPNVAAWSFPRLQSHLLMLQRFRPARAFLRRPQVEMTGSCC